MIRKWKSNRFSQEVANPFQVLESESGGVRGSAFRSLSEDGPSAAPSRPPPPPPQPTRLPEPETTVAPEPPHLPEPFELVVNEVEGSLCSRLSVDNGDEGPSLGLSLKKSVEGDPWSYSVSARAADAAEGASAASSVSEERPPSSDLTPLPPLPPPDAAMRKDDAILDSWASPAPQHSPLATHRTPYHEQQHFSSPMASTASLISSQIFTSGRVKLRCSWLASAAAILTALSAAVSLGNILRLPRLVLLHGGGPFLVAYVVLLLVLGLPLAFLEIGLGQFCQQGSLQIYRAVPLLKGVGIVKLIASLLMSAYYPVLMAVSFFSLIWSAKGPIPFEECLTRYQRVDEVESEALREASGLMQGETCLQKSILKPPQDDAMWLGVNYALLFLLWALLTLSQWGGSLWQRRSALVTVPVGLGLLIAILVQASTFKTLEWPLDWSNWAVLLEPEVWYFAMVQVFFSTQIGFGTNITNAGKIFPKKNAFWVALSLIFFNLLVGLGAVWVAWLWLNTSSVSPPMALKSDMPEVVILSLLLDYAGTAQMKAQKAWAALACAVLLIAGFISVASLLFTVITAIASETPAEKLRRWHIVVAICAVGFAAGVLIFVPSTLVFVHLLDHYVIGRLIVATTILELIGFAWIYGCDTLYNDFEFVLGQKMNKIWKVIWTLTPIILLGIELWSIFDLPLDGLPLSQKTKTPDQLWVTITGWTIYLSMWVVVLGSAIWTLGQQVDYNITDKLKSAIKPSSKWGPADPLHRHGWVRWRTNYSTTGRKDFTLRRRGTRDYTHSARASPNTTLVRTPKRNNGTSPLATSTPVAATTMPWQTHPSP